MKIFTILVCLCCSASAYADDTKQLYCDIEGLKYKIAAEFRDSKKTKADAINKLSKITSQNVQQTTTIVDTVFDVMTTRSAEWISGFHTGMCLFNFPNEESIVEVKKHKQT